MSKVLEVKSHFVPRQEKKKPEGKQSERKKRCNSVALVEREQKEEEKETKEEMRARYNKSIAEVEKDLFENDDDCDFEIKSILNHTAEKDQNRSSPFVIVGKSHVVQHCVYHQDQNRMSRKKKRHSACLEPSSVFD